jgi:hypothetical protein
MVQLAYSLLTYLVSAMAVVVISVFYFLVALVVMYFPLSYIYYIVFTLSSLFISFSFMLLVTLLHISCAAIVVLFRWIRSVFLVT